MSASFESFCYPSCTECLDDIQLLAAKPSGQMTVLRFQRVAFLRHSAGWHHGVNYDIKCATLSRTSTDTGIAIAHPIPIKCLVAKCPMTTDVYFFIYPMLRSVFIVYWLL